MYLESTEISGELSVEEYRNQMVTALERDVRSIAYAITEIRDLFKCPECDGAGGARITEEPSEDNDFEGWRFKGCARCDRKGIVRP